MKRQRYLVLKSTSGLRGCSSAKRGRVGAGGRQGDSIVAEELSAPEAESLRQTSASLVVPVMPLRLTSPSARESHRTGAGLAWGVPAVGAEPNKWDGRRAVVAVLDSGIDDAHSAFVGVSIVARNFTEGVDHDVDGHGTHCAGTIFGRNVGGQRIGIAPGVQKAFIGKVVDDKGGSTESLSRAFRWVADEGAHVISMSLSVDFPKYLRELVDWGLSLEVATSRALIDYRDTIRLFEAMHGDVVARADNRGAGVIVIAGAGNETDRSKADWRIGVGMPAAARGVVSVAALGEGTPLTIASFSNIGATVAAPGVEILSAACGGGLIKMSGTSMAAPHAAGVAALWVDSILSNGERYASDLLRSRLVGGCTRLPGLAIEDVGAGLVTAPK